MGSIRVTFGGGNLQDKTVKSAQVEQIVTADEGYTGINEVTVQPILLQDKTVTPSSETQEIIADIDYDGLGTVTVEAIPKWEPDADWWDIRQIVRDDVQSGYQYKSIFLIDDRFDSSYLNYGFKAYKTSDGAFYTNNTTTHTWDRSQDKSYSRGKTRWIIGYDYMLGYYSSPRQDLLYADLYNIDAGWFGVWQKRISLQAIEGAMSISKSPINLFNGCCSLAKIEFNPFNISSESSILGMCQDCYSLKELPNEIDLTNVTIARNAFCGTSIEKLPIADYSNLQNVQSFLYNSQIEELPDEWDLSSATNISYLLSECNRIRKYPTTMIMSQNITEASYCFQGNKSMIKQPCMLNLANVENCIGIWQDCTSLIEMQEEIDLSSCTNNGNMTFDCVNLLKLPKILIPGTASTNVVINFQYSINVIDKNSVATFDELGNIVDGMIYFLNTMDTSRPLTLNSSIKALFTADEQTAIQTWVTSKNWTLVW